MSQEMPRKVDWLNVFTAATIVLILVWFSLGVFFEATEQTIKFGFAITFGVSAMVCAVGWWKQNS